MHKRMEDSGFRTRAWANHITVTSPQVQRAKELEHFVTRLNPLFNRGEPLDMATRGLMEPFFGHDFRNTRIHRGYQAEEASRLMHARAFTSGGHIFGPHQNLDTSTRGGLGLLAHELTHVIQQTQPPRVPQYQTVKRESGLPSMVQNKGYSDTEMVLLASSQSSSITASRQQEEASAQANEHLFAQDSGNKAKSPATINAVAVADKVYHLMQHDLILERERTTKLGG